MPRDANGNYTLPPSNPVIAGTPITASWANPTMQDLGQEITNSLSRNGEGGMLVPFKNGGEPEIEVNKIIEKPGEVSLELNIKGRKYYLSYLPDVKVQLVE